MLLIAFRLPHEYETIHGLRTLGNLRLLQTYSLSSQACTATGSRSKAHRTGFCGVKPQSFRYRPAVQTVTRRLMRVLMNSTTASRV